MAETTWQQVTSIPQDTNVAISSRTSSEKLSSLAERAPRFLVKRQNVERQNVEIQIVDIRM
jgi:hypothetical protein